MEICGQKSIEYHCDYRRKQQRLLPTLPVLKQLAHS